MGFTKNILFSQSLICWLSVLALSAHNYFVSQGFAALHVLRDAVYFPDKFIIRRIKTNNQSLINIIWGIYDTCAMLVGLFHQATHGCIPFRIVLLCVLIHIIKQKSCGNSGSKTSYCMVFKSRPIQVAFQPIKWFPFASITSRKGNWRFNANMLLSSFHMVDILGFLGFTASSF